MRERATPERRGEERSDIERDELQLALDAGQMGRFRWDATTGQVQWDDYVERLFGLDPGTFEGTFDAYLALVHPDDRVGVVAVIQQAADAGGDAYRFEHRILLADGEVRWVEGRGMVDVGPGGAVLGARGVASDVTGRKRVELERDRAQDQLRLLAAANLALTSSLDLPQVLRELGRLVVPDLADACEVVLVDGDEIRRIVVGTAHEAEARELAALPDLADHPVRVAMARREAVVVHLAVQPDAFGPPDVPTTAAGLGLVSAVVAPLVVRERVLGALSLGRTERLAPFDDAGGGFVADLAKRVAIAVENCRLFADQRTMAVQLQRALLPDDIPAVPWADIAVRYRAGEAGLLIGGDWYDVATLGGAADAHARSVVFSIGDVVGHGIDAAVLMNRLRTALRERFAEGRGPAPALDALGAVMRQPRAVLFATVLAGRMDADGTLRLASAGHLPPLLVEPGRPPTFLPIAVSRPVGLPSAPRPDTVHEVPSGATLVLYTDGLVERRDEPLEESLARLAATADQAATRPVDELADLLLRELLPSGNRDDVALLVVRRR